MNLPNTRNEHLINPMTIHVNNLEPKPVGIEFRERMGIKFQSTSLPDRLFVGEVLRLFSAFYQRRAAIPPNCGRVDGAGYISILAVFSG